MKSRTFRSPVFWLLLVLAALLAFAYLPFGGDDDVEELTLSEFNAALAAGEIASVEMIEGPNVIEAIRLDGTEFEARYIGRDSNDLANRILAEAPTVDLKVSRAGGQSIWISLLFTLLPVFVFVGLFLWVFMRINGQRNNGFGKANAKKMEKDMPTVTFADVAGADEAVEELREIKEFLEDPVRFYSMGAKIPKGVLLYGPPGTGKTLLARAVAGEAGVPFFSISGSDFVEMFVGVGASRVRDLFVNRGRKNALLPSSSSTRSTPWGGTAVPGLGGGHDEREQTLNQLLVEMDGFETNERGDPGRRDQPARTCSIRRCCGPAGSTARSPSTAPTSTGAGRSSTCTPRASPWPPTSTSTPSPSARPGSPVPTWPT